MLDYDLLAKLGQALSSEERLWFSCVSAYFRDLHAALRVADDGDQLLELADALQQVATGVVVQFPSGADSHKPDGTGHP